MKGNKNNLIKYIYTVLVFGVLCKSIVLIKDLQLASTFGSSLIVDNLIMSQSMIGLPIMIVNTILTASFIPEYLKVKKIKGDAKAEEFFLKITFKVILLSLLFSAALFVFKDYYIYIFASGYRDDKLILLSSMFSISLIGVTFTIVTNMLTLRFQAVNEYKITTLVAVPQTILIMVVIYGSSIYNNKYLAYVNIVGPIVGFVFLLYFYLKINIVIKKISLIKLLHISNEEKAIFFLAAPLLISSLFNQVNLIVDRNIISSFDDGSLSSMSYAVKICTIFSSILMPVLAVFLPSLSEKSAQNRKDEISSEIRNILINTFYLLLPILAFISINSLDIVKMVFMRGAFTLSDAENTAYLMLPYLFSLAFFQFANGVFVRGFFSIKKINITIGINLVTVVVNILGNYYLSNYLGIYGIALSTLIACIVGFVLYMISFSKEFCDFFNYKLIREICTSVFITLFSVIVFNIFMEYSIIFSHSSFIVSLFMKFIFFAFIFIVFSCLFKVSYYINLIKMKGIT